MLVCRTDFDRGLDRFLDRTMNEMGLPNRGPVARGIALDLLEHSEAFILRADVPGMKREDIELTLEENRLTIAGRRTLSSEEEARVHLSERGAVGFERAFELPASVVSEEVTASLADGVLEVKIPKVPEEEPRKIEITVH
jgi:HSP20 family protein